MNYSLSGLPKEIIEMTEILQRGMGERYRPVDMLRFLLSDTLRVFSIPQNTRTPAESRGCITRCLSLYGAAVRARPFEDLLGPVLLSIIDETKDPPGAKLAFTLQVDAELSAKASLPEPWMDVGPGLLRMLEPACGSGVMVLAMMKAISERDGLAALSRWSFTLVDINETCVLLSIAQILTNLHFQSATVGELVAYQGNSTDIGLAVDPNVIVHLHKEGVHPNSSLDARRLEEVRTAARAQLVVVEPEVKPCRRDNDYPLMRKAS